MVDNRRRRVPRRNVASSARVLDGRAVTDYRSRSRNSRGRANGGASIPATRCPSPRPYQNLTSSVKFLRGTNPGLAPRLQSIPRAAKRWRVGENEVAHRVDGHAVVDRRRGDIDALGDLGMTVAEQLDAEQTGGVAIAREAHGNAMAVRVVRLVVVGLVAHRDGVESCGSRFTVSNARTRRGHVEDLDHLRAQTPGEAPVASESVLTCDATLLVRRGPERKV